MHNILSPFHARGKVNTIVVALFVLINSVVAVNAVLHDPHVQYDADGHDGYVTTLARLSLPMRTDSSEFFSPPLPYLFPAALHAAGIDLWSALKLAQLLNVGLSLGVTYLLLRLLHLLQPDDPSLRVHSLFFLGMVPVYYRTMSYVRGEPYVLFFTVVCVYLTLRILLGQGPAQRQATALGIAGGCLALSRQWGALIVPALAIFVAIETLGHRHRFRQRLVAFATAVVIALALLLPFYVSLYARFGTFLAFNQQAPPEFTLANQPPDFYRGLGLRHLFTAPVRPNYANQFIPTLYSDMWGDYWYYFLVYGRDGTQFISGVRLLDRLDQGITTNRDDIARYLGRVNLVALLPSAIVLASVLYSAGRFLRWLRGGASPVDMLAAVSLMIVVASCIGYFWFVVNFPALDTGDTIKATYMAHLIPFAAVSTALGVTALRQRARSLYRVVMVLLLAVSVYVAPAFVTRYFSV